MTRIAVAAISDRELEEVGAFLNANLNSRISASEWTAALRAPWGEPGPNRGYMIRADDMVVGAYVAFYSKRIIDGRTEHFCNLGPWCVLTEHRMHSVRLLLKLLSQPGYHFTDLSPSGAVVSINERLKFTYLNTMTALLPNLPWPAWRSSGARLICQPAEIATILNREDVRVFDDHLHAPAAHHVVLTCRNDYCYVIFRRDRRKGMPFFASLLYVSSPTLFRSLWRVFGSHALLSHRLPFTLAECRLVGPPLPGTIPLSRVRPKMFKSDRLRPDQVDYLYSELTCIPW